MGQLAFFDVENSGKLSELKSYDNWSSSWTHIVPGNYGGTGHTDLLFYDQRTGDAEFYLSNGTGEITQIREIRGRWRKTWTKIISGNFSGGGLSDLLFYEGSTGRAEFYANDGNAKIRNIKVIPEGGWSTGISHIIPGNFAGSPLTDLFFYSSERGSSAFYVNDGNASMNPVSSIPEGGWRKTWTKIIPGNFAGSDLTDLLFYEGSTGRAEFHANDGNAKLRNIRTIPDGGWNQWISQIIPGNFSGGTLTDLLFYNRNEGSAAFYVNKGEANLAVLETIKAGGWRKTWQQILPVNFGSNQSTGLMFFDRPLSTDYLDYRIASCPSSKTISCSYEEMLDHTPRHGSGIWVNGKCGILIRQRHRKAITSIKATVFDRHGNKASVDSEQIFKPYEHAVVDREFWAVMLDYINDLKHKGIRIENGEVWAVSVDVKWSSQQEKLTLMLNIAS